MTLTLAHALAGLPPASPFRKVLPGLLDPDEDKRTAAYDKLQDITSKDRKLGKREAIGLLRAATELTFPPQTFDWNDTVHDLIFPLVASPHAELVPIARAAYPRVSERARCAILSLLGACASRDAAKAVMACVRNHGWPSAYPRVFSELRNLDPFADVLFPDLVKLAGPNIGGVTDALVDGLASGRIDARRIKLDAIAPLVTSSLRLALSRAQKQQRASGTAWRFTEAYWPHRQAAGAWLDIAGHVRAKSLDSLLRKAMAMPDPKLALFAAVSVLRRNGAVPAAVLERIAACHETREILFDKLRELDKLALFPAAWRTWDAFATSQMVGWLLFPSELGHEPAAIEQMAVFAEGPRTLHVFRFRATERSPWLAGVAGPFVRRGQPRPSHGELTFSRFDTWSSATPEQHALAVVKTLKTWRAA